MSVQTVKDQHLPGFPFTLPIHALSVLAARAHVCDDGAAADPVSEDSEAPSVKVAYLTAIQQPQLDLRVKFNSKHSTRPDDRDQGRVHV